MSVLNREEKDWSDVELRNYVHSNGLIRPARPGLRCSKSSESESFCELQDKGPAEAGAHGCGLEGGDPNKKTNPACLPPRCLNWHLAQTLPSSRRQFFWQALSNL